jgi:hypothetical protein
MGIKPMGRNGVKPMLSSSQVGSCTICKAGIFSHQPYAQVRRPATGKNHLECVPKGAVVLEVVQP